MKAKALRDITNWDYSVWARHEEERTVVVPEGTLLDVVGNDDDGDLAVTFPGSPDWHFLPSDLLEVVGDDEQVHLNWQRRDAMHWVAFYPSQGALYECDIYGLGGFSAYIVQRPGGYGVLGAPSGSIRNLEDAQAWCQKAITALVSDTVLPSHVELPF